MVGFWNKFSTVILQVKETTRIETFALRKKSTSQEFAVQSKHYLLVGTLPEGIPSI